MRSQQALTCGGLGKMLSMILKVSKVHAIPEC